MKKVTSYPGKTEDPRSKHRDKLQRGFTLIELLIVITLIGILAIAVLSAINPIEQVNKARDAGRSSDASQMLKAIERYYVNNEIFPWNKFTPPGTSPDAPFKGTMDMLGAGICNSATGTSYDYQATGTTGCDSNSGTFGSLIEADELKSQFTKRRYFKSSRSVNDVMIVIKELSDPSTAVCYVPASKTTRDKWNINGGGLKFISNVAVGAGGLATSLNQSTSIISDCATARGAVEPLWTDMSEACYTCIPEE